MCICVFHFMNVPGVISLFNIFADITFVSSIFMAKCEEKKVIVSFHFSNNVHDLKSERK